MKPIKQAIGKLFKNIDTLVILGQWDISIFITVTLYWKQV